MRDKHITGQFRAALDFLLKLETVKKDPFVSIGYGNLPPG